jgi:hypothetical protein
MPMNLQFTSDQAAITPTGPRNMDWLRKTARGEISGEDFFAWNQPGLHAEYFLRRALVRMWCDVRWRSPTDDTEREILEEVADSLLRAYKLDPTLTFPWTEWAEVLQHLQYDREEFAMVRSRGTEPSEIGYRRNDVCVILPGRWSIRIPGSFSDFAPDEEGDFVSLDPPKEIWFTAYEFDLLDDASFEARRQEIRDSRPEYLQENDGYIAKAAITRTADSTGDEYFVLRSSQLRRSGRAVCTIVFYKATEKELALRIWRSISPP